MDLSTIPRLLLGCLCAAACSSSASSDSPPQGVQDQGEQQSVAVVVQDIEGSSLPGASVWFKPSDEPDYPDLAVVTGSDGIARSGDSEWPDEEQGYDVVVLHRGYRSLVLRGLAGMATVRLPPSVPTRIRVRFATGSVLPEEPERLQLRLDWFGRDGDDDPRRFDPEKLSSVFPSDGMELEFLVDDPGTYVLRAFAIVRSGELWPSIPDAGGEWHRLLTTDPTSPTVTLEFGQRTAIIEAFVDATRRGEDH